MKNQNFNPSENDPLKQNQNPVSSGPQFNAQPEETNGGWRDWIRKYGSSVVLPIIALLILAGGIYLYSTQKSDQGGIVLNDNNQQEELSEEDILDMIEQEQTGQEESEEGQETPAEETDTTSDSQKTAPEIISQDEAITIKAGTGDGITHLARYALKEHLKDNSQELTNEHKIYIEDYLKDQIGSRPLEVGEEVSFSKELIQEAIDAANQLTESQLENLQQYSEKVNWN